MSKKLLLPLLSAAVLSSSCATVKYNDNPDLNTYTELSSGRAYSLTLKNGKTEKFIYNTMTRDSLIGSRDGKKVAFAKKDLRESADLHKRKMTTAAGIIGVAGAAALILTSSRADK